MMAVEGRFGFIVDVKVHDLRQRIHRVGLWIDLGLGMNVLIDDV